MKMRIYYNTLIVILIIFFTSIICSENVSKLIVYVGPKIKLEAFTKCNNTTKIYNYLNSTLENVENIYVKKIENTTCRISINIKSWNKSSFIYNISPILKISGGKIQYLVKTDRYLRIEELYPKEGNINSPYIYIKVSFNVVSFLSGFIVFICIPILVALVIIYYIRAKINNIKNYEDKIKIVSKINKLWLIYIILVLICTFLTLFLFNFPNGIIFITGINRFIIFSLFLVVAFSLLFGPIIYSMKYTTKLYGKSKSTKSDYLLSTLQVLGFVFTYLVIILIIIYTPTIILSLIKKLPLPLQVLFYMLIGFIIAHTIFSIVSEITFKKLEKPLEPWVIETINELVSQLKIKNFKKVRVIDTIGGKVANAMVKGIINKELILTEKLIEILNKEELKAIIAHEIAHKKSKHIESLIFLYFIFGVIIFSTMQYCIQYFEKIYYQNNILINYIDLFFICTFIVSYLLLFLIIRYFQRKAEKSADLIASEVTNPKTFIKALVKISIANLNPIENDRFDVFSTHPTIFKRVVEIGKRFKLSEEEVLQIIQEAYTEMFKNNNI